MAESYFFLQWLQAMFVGTSAAAYALAKNNNNKENNMSRKTTPPPPPPRRLLRSVLYVPASDMEGMRQALLSAADAVVLDLEDTVAPHDKDVARANVITLLQGLAARTVPRAVPTVVVRINCMDSTPWGVLDLRALASVHCDAVLLPKVEDPARVHAAMDILERHRTAAGTTKALWCMVETPRGVQRVDAIADMDGVAALVFGSNDLTTELKGRQTESREALLYALSKVVNAARAAGKLAVDGVYGNPQVDNVEGLTRACQQGRDLGFDGKTMLHASQIDVANRTFRPGPEEVANARKAIHAYEGQTGMIVVDGQLISRPRVERAKILVAEAEDIERIVQGRKQPSFRAGGDAAAPRFQQRTKSWTAVGAECARH